MLITRTGAAPVNPEGGLASLAPVVSTRRAAAPPRHGRRIPAQVYNEALSVPHQSGFVCHRHQLSAVSCPQLGENSVDIGACGRRGHYHPLSDLAVR